MKDIILYNHSGSGNHGCEAIVRSFAKITGQKVELVSYRPNEEYIYGIDEVVSSITTPKEICKSGFKRVLLYIMRHVFHNHKLDYKYEFSYLINKKNIVAVSIGGDLYCGNNTERLSYLNKVISKRNTSVLMGCSIEPQKLQDKKLVEDMRRYDLISARESITYDALVNAGIRDNVILCADPAFQLDTIKLPLPDGFEEGNTVGINISPLVIKHENQAGILRKSYTNLIKHIINNTNYQIAFIPHVVWTGVSDLTVIKELFSEFQNTGRVVMITDHNCMELKGYIARCNMFIGARTHSTIAAYSSCIPTLVVGYSVKALGIAKDLFGTTENYVVPTQGLKTGNELLEAFIWLDENKSQVRMHLEEIMPQYTASSFLVNDMIKSIIGENDDNHK